MSYTLVLQFYEENGQKPMQEKTEQKQNSTTIMIPVDRKRTVFPVTLKLQGKLFE